MKLTKDEIAEYTKGCKMSNEMSEKRKELKAKFWKLDRNGMESILECVGDETDIALLLEDYQVSLDNADMDDLAYMEKELDNLLS